jgi:hypothetical protein
MAASNIHSTFSSVTIFLSPAAFDLANSNNQCAMGLHESGTACQMNNIGFHDLVIKFPIDGIVFSLSGQRCESQLGDGNESRIMLVWGLLAWFFVRQRQQATQGSVRRSLNRVFKTPSMVFSNAVVGENPARAYV